MKQKQTNKQTKYQSLEAFNQLDIFYDNTLNEMTKHLLFDRIVY